MSTTNEVPVPRGVSAPISLLVRFSDEATRDIPPVSAVIIAHKEGKKDLIFPDSLGAGHSLGGPRKKKQDCSVFTQGRPGVMFPLTFGPTVTAWQPWPRKVVTEEFMRTKA